MKIIFHCPECAFDEAQYSEQPPLGLEDDNAYTFTCSRGHKNTMVIKSHKFQLLFTSGTLAFLDGYLSESVLSFAAAFERFCEYYIRVIALKNCIKLNEIENLWKTMSSQSQRQYGAFAMCYLIENNKAFDEKHFKLNNAISFRNMVIHKGYFPNADEVLEYAETVYEFLKENILHLKNDCAESLKVFDSEYIDKSSLKAPNGSAVTIYSPRVLPDLRWEDEKFIKLTFNDELERFKKWRNAE